MEYKYEQDNDQEEMFEIKIDSGSLVFYNKFGYEKIHFLNELFSSLKSENKSIYDATKNKIFNFSDLDLKIVHSMCEYGYITISVLDEFYANRSKFSGCDRINRYFGTDINTFDLQEKYNNDNENDIDDDNADHLYDGYEEHQSDYEDYPENESLDD
jgi:hypothetical protein